MPEISAAAYELSLPEGHDQQLTLGHIFDGVAEAFAAEARIFDATVWHLVDTETGNVAHDEAADLKLLKRGLDQESILRQQSRLQSIGGVVDVTERLFKRLIRLNRDHRAKDLGAVHPHVSRRTGEHGGFNHRTVPLAAAEQLGSCLDSFVDPFGYAHRILLANERGNVGRFQGWIATLQLADAF